MNKLLFKFIINASCNPPVPSILFLFKCSQDLDGIGWEIALQLHSFGLCVE